MSEVQSEAAPRSKTSAPKTAPAASPFEFSSKVVMIHAPESSEAEAIRVLRTHLMARHVQEGRRGLVICAPTPEVGCSYIAVNLAVAFAQAGVHTLLLEGDMRDPGFDAFIRVPGDKGLRHCLEASEDILDECVHSEVLPNLSVLAAGGSAANAQELLATDQFGDLASRCLRDYQITIIDSPPSSQWADVLRLSQVAGYSLIVAQRGKSLIQDINMLIQELDADNARVVGTVMNDL